MIEGNDLAYRLGRAEMTIDAIKAVVAADTSTYEPTVVTSIKALLGLSEGEHAKTSPRGAPLSLVEGQNA